MSSKSTRPVKRVNLNLKKKLFLPGSKMGFAKKRIEN